MDENYEEIDVDLIRRELIKQQHITDHFLSEVNIKPVAIK